ncbi:hypothetical protein [Congregibacter litoralis]|uniref:Glycosyl transferase family 2 n=1 Tax=Congregibacter litoralis KT71 TaxID=314285 RepID=A4A7N2_9GAMM|nr:hypothetical protein [Congregibacter litoralis]EAQ98301.1 hypothetical protein KT71_03602 [Congregibacter litoralis KT71]
MKVVRQYLERYAAPEAPAILEALTGAQNGPTSPPWQQVLVIPAYKENAALLNSLQQFSQLLLILVLNRPDTEADPHCNDALRNSLSCFKALGHYPQANSRLYEFGEKRGEGRSEERGEEKSAEKYEGSGNHILLVERAEPLPQKEGVGLARKIGCDIALALSAGGFVTSPWIHCSDADAILPADYFAAARAVQGDNKMVALTYPFEHIPPADARERRAIALYEAYLHHYVEGLRKARSPYAFHTIGSCIAVKTDAYALVRGFPRRAAGEDFYLLNKVAKHGSVHTPHCEPLRLSARLSSRVPFGTGPAMARLLSSDQPESVALFYDPRCFEALAALIRFVEDHGFPGSKVEDLAAQLNNHPELLTAVIHLGLENFLEHAKKQCADQGAFIDQYHQWLDGFRTLKLINALSRRWPKLTAAESAQRQTHR